MNDCWSKVDNCIWNFDQKNHVNAHIRLALPDQSKWRVVLCWFRLIVTLMFFIELVTIIVIYPEAVFIHFTFWGIMTLVFTYLLFIIDHARRRHFCNKWGDPLLSDEISANLTETTSPCVLWKAAHILFQCAFLINHSIAVYYWLVLWPFVIIKQKLYMEDYQ
jgi:hypothetical protein